MSNIGTVNAGVDGGQAYPYDDEFMSFDAERVQYVITEKALLSRGIDLRADLASTSAVSPENVIKMVVLTASDMIYGYIHQFSADNELQNYLIATRKDLRQIIFEAMLYQAIYIRRVGNLYYSTDDGMRKKAIDEIAKQWLERTVPSLGTSILYAGGY